LAKAASDAAQSPSFSRAIFRGLKMVFDSGIIGKFTGGDISQFAKDKCFQRGVCQFSNSISCKQADDSDIDWQ
jgi:hypothetical protein